jgi:[ribosomal protein S5]-alanine N-acetyltransferase
MIVFETERLIIRAISRDDYDNFFLLHSNPGVMEFIRPVKTREESDAFLDKALLGFKDQYLGRWAVEEKQSGKFVGSFVIVPIPEDEEKIQLGYLFTPDEWGKGYATEVTKAGINYFMRNSLLNELYAVVETPNFASQRVLLKAGFQPHTNKEEDGKELLVFILYRK